MSAAGRGRRRARASRLRSGFSFSTVAVGLSCEVGAIRATASRAAQWQVNSVVERRCSNKGESDGDAAFREIKLMARSSNNIDVYLEIGNKRTFAGAIDWPGWCRSGRDEGSALQALFGYAPRYARVLRAARLGFRAPVDTSAFAVIERLKGNATTDFGAPAVGPSSDARPVDDAELRRFQALLNACWRAFDVAAKAATGKELRKGPRGGGRDLEGIVQHVLGADAGYLARLAWQLKQSEKEDPGEALARTRQAILNALASTARGEVPARGPRGGVRWTPRYFVRRVAWHVLDHAWEIEDRIT